MVRQRGMFGTTVFMAVVTLTAFALAYIKGKNQHVEGVKAALHMMAEIFPLLIFAFLFAGIIQSLLPVELLSRWIGRGSGLKGIFIGTIAGGLCPGGPYVSLPLAAGFLRSGAGVGTMVAFITSWSLWAVSRLPMEIGIMGWKFTLIRLASTFLFPPIAGLLANLLFSGVKI